MKKLVFGLVSVLWVVVFVPPVLADFIGPYDVGNWTTTLTGSPPGGGGTIDTSGAPASIEIVGGDLGCSGGPCNIDFTIAAIASGLASFDWAYETTDDDGPSFDQFGFLLNGFFTQLSDDNGGISQSGSEAFAVSLADVFGFRFDCTDCGFGPALVTISNFDAPLAAVVPEPSTLLLLGSGLLAWPVLARRKKR
jgi:PEP-CTERM motif